MKTILVGGFAAYILARGKIEHPAQYETFKNIIEGVRCGGVKVPMAFESFGHLHFQDGGPSEGRTVYLNGTSEIEERWDITEQVVTIFGDFPETVATQQRLMLAERGLTIGEVTDLPFHQERRIRSIVRQDDRLNYHLERHEARTTWDETLTMLEGPKPSDPGLLDHLTS